MIGVDTNPANVDPVNSGRAPVIEDDPAELMARGVEEGRLRGTTDCGDAIEGSDLAFVCVGTPSQTNAFGPDRLRQVCQDIGAELGRVSHFFTVDVRSTILPRTTRRLWSPSWRRPPAGGCARASASASTPSSCGRKRA